MKRKFYNGLKLIIILVISVCFTPSQQKDSDTNQSVQLEKFLNKKDGDWLYFNNGLKIPIVEFFSKNKASLDFNDDFGIRIEKEDTDDLGMIHYLLRLTYKNIVIDDSWYTAHYSKDGDILIFEGKFAGEIPKTQNPTISETDAIIIAKNALTTSETMPLEYFQLLKKDLSDATKENKRVNCEMVYFKSKDQNYILVYKVILTTTISLPMHQFYIDANDGEILKDEELVFKSTNTVATKYNGTRTIQTTYTGYPNFWYVLLNTSKPTPIDTRNSTFIAGWDNCVPNVFANLNSTFQSSSYWAYDAHYNAASAHWAVQEAYNVFYNRFSRTYGTFTNSGGSIRVENNYFKRREYINGSIVNRSTFYEPGGSYDYIHAGNIYGTEGFDGGLDVIGHEFTHGCLYRSRSISTLSGCEAGALMESLCDIFGEVIEYYTLGSTDYMFGTNDKPRYRRDFINPENDSIFYAPTLSSSCTPTIVSEAFFRMAPSTWHGTNWYYTQDQNYNYVNCSVQNRWFYLLSEGGTQNGVNVTGIGIEKAANITYRNLAYYFNNSYTFESMRNASISNAQILYGACSNEYQQVMNAWAAVGVGTPAPSPCVVPLTGYISGPAYAMCGDCQTWYANASGGNGNYNYSWWVNYQYISNGAYLTYCFPSYQSGYYTIDLIINDGQQTFSTNIYVSVDCYYLLNNQTPFSIIVFPNPSSGYVTLDIVEEEDFPATLKNSQYTIYLTDKSGRIHYNVRTKNRKVDIAVPNLQNGTYSIIAIIGKYKMSTELVINH